MFTVPRSDNGKEDVAIFDFTSMYSAEYAARILERRGKRLIIGLVGDGLMEVRFNIDMYY